MNNDLIEEYYKNHLGYSDSMYEKVSDFEKEEVVKTVKYAAFILSKKVKKLEHEVESFYKSTFN